MDDDVEDITINVDEVNTSFLKGYEIEGKQFLEKIEKQLMGNENLNEEDEKKIIKSFDYIARKLSKGKIEILNELEKFDINSEIITRLSLIGVEYASKLKSNSSNSSNNSNNSNLDSKYPNKLPNVTRNTTDDRYADEGFEDYENDFEDYDDIDKRAHTSDVVLPKFTDKEPAKIRSKTAPSANSQASTPSSSQSTTKSRTHSSGKIKKLAWINKGHWRLGEKIGSGSFGDVFQGMSDDGYLFAVKQLKIVDDKEIANLISEIELMQNLDHPNIVKYLGAKVIILLLFKFTLLFKNYSLKIIRLILIKVLCIFSKNGFQVVLLLIF